MRKLLSLLIMIVATTIYGQAGSVGVTSYMKGAISDSIANSPIITANTAKVTYPATASATELNILDGATITTSDLNKVGLMDDTLTAHNTRLKSINSAVNEKASTSVTTSLSARLDTLESGGGNSDWTLLTDQFVDCSSTNRFWITDTSIDTLFLQNNLVDGQIIFWLSGATIDAVYNVEYGSPGSLAKMPIGGALEVGSGESVFMIATLQPNGLYYTISYSGYVK